MAKNEGAQEHKGIEIIHRRFTGQHSYDVVNWNKINGDYDALGTFTSREYALMFAEQMRRITK